MKKSDLITAALIAIIGTIAAYFLVDSILGNPEEETVSFKYIGNTISGINEPAAPDSELFNNSAINPTVDVYVGDGSCIDQNQDGELDIAEKIACGTASMEEVEEAKKQNEANQATEDDVDRALMETRRQNINNNTNNTSTSTNINANTNTSTNTSGTRTTTGE